MSVQAITAALAIQGVTASEKLLLLTLANYADAKMQCWPSHSRLASDTCMSDRTILRLMASLEKKGHLTRKARFREKLRRSDLITLFKGGDTMSPRGDIDGQKVGTPCPQGGDTVSPRTVKEPKEEPSARARLSLVPESEPHALEELEDRKVLAAGMRELLNTLSASKKISTRKA